MGGLWKWVRALMKGFDFQSGVKMSLATFSSTGEVYSRLGSYSQGQVDNALNGLIGNLQATAESNLNHGLKTARKEFRSYGSGDSDKAIILITDGWSTSDNTPFYHANLAVKEGIDIYTIGFGPVLNNEYLHITSMGKVENTLFAQDIQDMWDQIVNVQEKVCGTDSNDVLYNQQVWQDIRYDIDSSTYSAMGNRYDVTQTIDLKRVMDMGFAFENWMAKESVYGLVTDLTRMNLNDTVAFDF